MDDFKLPVLLKNCCDRYSLQHQAAWFVFMKRYKEFIYYNVTIRCKDWNIARLNFQFNEVVNDVVGSVINILCENDFRALKNFRNPENEKQFHWYLITICHHATARYMKKYLKRYIELDPEEMHETINEMADDSSGQLYESIVATLRSHGKKERDINLFLLSVWGRFDKKMLLSLPGYRGKITSKMIDNSVYRMREILREYGIDGEI